MANLLLEEVEYKVDTTRFGTWRRYVYPNGELFEEFCSHRQLFGLPLFHYTHGRSPETGRRIIAKGIIAVGRIAFGGLALGHAALGLLAVGQLALGLGFGLGQAATGIGALGQAAVGIRAGVGQFATGQVAVGQFALGGYVLAQIGYGMHVWDTRRADPAAVDYFYALLPGAWVFPERE